MLYIPSIYSEDRTELIHQIIKEHGFATLITNSPDGLTISHLPLLLEMRDGQPVLLGHCAKANYQWKHFEQGQAVTVLFQGPHSYISPAWYQPQPDNVSTWNYVAVHVQGVAAIIDDPNEVYQLLQKLTNYFEKEYETGWSLPAEVNPDLSDLFQYIVGFEISIKDIQAKFKLSQKQDPTDRNNVIQKLSEMHDQQKGVSDWMKRTGNSTGRQ